MLVLKLVQALRNNLRVLSIATSVPPLQIMSQGSDTRLYFIDDATPNKRTRIGARITIPANLPTADKRLRFAKKLCDESELKYLGIFGTFLEICTARVTQIHDQHDGQVTWLHQITSDRLQYSALYETVFTSGSL